MAKGLTNRAAALGDRVVTVDDLLQAAAGGVHRDRDSIALLRRPGREIDPAVLDGLLARGHREVDEAAHPACHLGVHARGRIEALHLGCDADVEVGGIEVGDGSAAADTCLGIGPERRMVVPDGGDGTDAGDDRATGWIGVGHGTDGLLIRCWTDRSPRRERSRRPSAEVPWALQPDLRQCHLWVIDQSPM